jgi:hypothetical protein
VGAASNVGYLARRNTIGHQQRWHFRVALAHAPAAAIEQLRWRQRGEVFLPLYLSSYTRPNQYSQNSAGTKFEALAKKTRRLLNF